MSAERKQNERGAQRREPGGRPHRFLRRRSWFCGLTAVLFLAGCAGAIALTVLYRWPSVSAPVYYFIVRPAFVWFGGAALCVGAGLFGVRFKWFLLGCALWAAGFLASEEASGVLKLSAGSAREQYAVASMAYRSYVRRGQPAPGELAIPLRIVTWNVAGGRFGSNRAVSELARLEPDIVLLQESHGHGLKTALEENPQLGSYHRAGVRTSILSRFPVQPVPEGPLPESLGSAWLVEVSPDRSLVCVNVHLSPQKLRTQVLRGWTLEGLEKAVARARNELEQVQRALEHHGKTGPVILGGDFNLPPHYPDLRSATAALTECFAENGYGWGKTAPAKLPAMRVDMVFVPPASRVYYSGAVPTRFSDHYMALAEVQIPIRAREEPPAIADHTVRHEPDNDR